MDIAIVAFDAFTDVDLFMPWDLFYRVKNPHYGFTPRRPRRERLRKISIQKVAASHRPWSTPRTS